MLNLCFEIINAFGCFIGNLMPTRVTWDEDTAIRKLSLLDWTVGVSVEHFLDWQLIWESPAQCRQCHPWVGGHGDIRKQAMESKMVSSVLFMTVLQTVPKGFSLELLPWLSTQL